MSLLECVIVNKKLHLVINMNYILTCEKHNLKKNTEYFKMLSVNLLLLEYVWRLNCKLFGLREVFDKLILKQKTQKPVMKSIIINLPCQPCLRAKFLQLWCFPRYDHTILLLPEIRALKSIRSKKLLVLNCICCL